MIAHLWASIFSDVKIQQYAGFHPRLHDTSDRISRSFRLENPRKKKHRRDPRPGGVEYILNWQGVDCTVCIH